MSNNNEEDLNKKYEIFKKNLTVFFDKLTYTNLGEKILTSNDKVMECRPIIEKALVDIGIFGQKVPKSEWKWIYGIKKGLELRKFILNEYYNVASYINTNKFDSPASLPINMATEYFSLLSKALDRISSLEGHNLDDFINVKLLVSIKKGLNETYTKFRSYFEEELSRLSKLAIDSEGFNSEALLSCLDAFKLIKDLSDEDKALIKTDNITRLLLRSIKKS
jgi:hypothetical protein